MKNQKRIKALLLSVFVLLFSFCTIVPTVYADDRTNPIVIMQSYEVEGDVSVGNDFTLRYTLYNTSASTGVENVLVTFSDQHNVFFPSHGSSNQTYINSIASRSTIDSSTSFYVAEAIPDGTYYVSFSASYQTSGENFSVTTTGTIALSVTSGSVEILEITIPEQSEQNEPTYIGIRYVYTGEEDYTNMRIMLEGAISEDSRVILLENSKTASGLAEGYVTFIEPANQSISATIVYETEFGVSEQSSPYSITTLVSPQNNFDDAEDLSAQQDSKFNIMSYLIENILILIAVVIVGIVIVVMLLMERKKHAHKPNE